jgi:Ca2+-binding RTX toxin-like protein
MVDVPNNTTTTAVLETTTDNFVGTYSGRLETVGDHDWIRVSLEAGTAYEFFLSFQGTGSTSGDSVLTLRNSTGAILDVNNDAAPGDQNSFLTYTPPATGTYYIDVGEFGNNDRGAYSVLMMKSVGINVFLTGADESHTASFGQKIAGGAGDDIIDLGASGFVALGEQGDDTLFAISTVNDDLVSGGLGNDFLAGGPGDDFMFGDAGDDTLFGGLNNDQMFGGDGFDDLFGEDGNDHLSGGADDDVLSGGLGADTMRGGMGADKLDGGNDNDTFVIAGSEGLGDIFIGGLGIDKLQVTGAAAVTLAGFNAATSSIEQWQGNGKGVVGTSATNIFNFAALTAKSGLTSVDGGAGNDTITGSKFADTLIGNAGNDTLNGGLGNDTLTGGLGKDTLTGGANKDIFDFNTLKDSVKGVLRDKILDFSHGQGDRIDLSTIDAKTHVGGNQGFHFIGTHAFAHHDGELRCAGGIIQGDVNGDGKADFEIHVNLATLIATDFVL